MPFNLLTNLVITINTVLIAITVQRKASGQEVYQWLHNLELSFLMFYIMELLLRLYANGLPFFYGREAGWHWFDLALVAMAMVEMMSASVGSNVSYFRALRLLKITRVLRLLRVMRSMKELRVILDATLGAMRSLAWSLVFMISTTFIFAILFVQGATERFGQGAADDRWVSILSSMALLFASTTGGVDWKEIADSIWEIGILYFCFFYFYVCFFIFVIANVVTSLFVERVLSKISSDEQTMVNDRMSKRLQYVQQIQGLFARIDADHDGQVSLAELTASLHDKAMVEFAASLDIEESDLTMCFSILTGNGRLTVDTDTFVVGCIKLRGNARSVDVIDLAMGQNVIMSHLRKLFSEFADVRSLISGSASSGGGGASQPMSPKLPPKRRSDTGG